MKDPRDALEAARAAAASIPGAAEADGAPWSEDAPVDSARRLARWAIIEPDAGQVYSTRRYGRPITAVKRGLVLLLRQYIGQVSAQQSRFNAEVAAHVVRLEERVAGLERAAGLERTAEPERTAEERPDDGSAP
ncbi:MAG TPA: hypothetical protein VHV28_15945 [Solirubrobacteraceae bacterium]|nr:hypothetical protein [Solirubrobacteraceae bacterium]